ncbi:MAG TPA: isoleucine--tRNA ligase [Nanoarchaeota archaeon]|nr:isoleucine--tRNA ligase [Nanoarchaeota archaeon]
MYDFKAVELEMLDYWSQSRIYPKLKKKGEGKKKFYFLQGPPYTSGRLHMGHAWNNSLKDMVLRYKRMQGFDVWDRAGYDMHGLPTEHKVQAQFDLKTKEDIVNFGLDRFTKECIKFSSEKAKMMDADLWRLGIWMDYDNAYWPIKNEYIEGIWWLIKKAHEKNRLYEGLRTITWCASCGTALAKHECQYKEREEPSIFVKFPIKGRKGEYFLIWTTTPWTLAYNLAIMANPELDYVKVDAGDGEKWIMAKGLAGAVMQAVVGKPLKVIEEFRGDKLEGIEYEHPWRDQIKDFAELKKKHPRVHTVLLSSEYVSLDAGSGLVHCAPGCGPEDYEVGYKHNVPPYNNIDQYGIFPDNMGRFSGLKAKTDDRKFIDALKDYKILVAEVPVEHDYAHCERCHNPVVFRTTKQWFFKVEDLKDKMVRADSSVLWVPDAGKNAFDSWLSHLRDNSITKQRFWGTPIPIWRCDKCNEYIVVESVEELKKLKAKNIPESLHKPWIDFTTVPCKCGGEMHRLPDIIDVWVDAGSASWNCLYYPKQKDLFDRYFPADFILEAKEQVRGWFNLLMVASMIAFDKPCFKAVYMHGMLTDVEGQKMSKSLGNVISPYELIDKHGADTLRYYLCSTPAGEDINFSWEEAGQCYRNLTILLNVHNYLIEYAKTAGINPAKLKPTNLGIEEKYMLSKLNRTIKEVTELYEVYEIDRVPRKLEALFLELSRVYIQLTREKATSAPKPVLYTIYNVVFELIKMLSTVAPFISEKMYLNMKEAFALKDESVAHLPWPKADLKKIDEKLEKQMENAQAIIQSILSAREKAQVGVRWPLREAVVATENKDAASAVMDLKELIMRQANLKDIKVEAAFSKLKVEIKANANAIGKDFKQNAGRIIAALDAKTLEKIRKEGKVAVVDVSLTKDHISVAEILPKGYSQAEFRHGNVYIDTALTPELEAEGFAREVTRRVQELRKKNGLRKQDEIELSIVSDYDLEQWGKEIKAKVGAKTMSFADKGFQNVHEEKIKDQNFRISFRVL